MTDTTQAPENPKAAAKAAKAYAKATRPWYKKKRWIAAIVVGVIIVAAALGGGGDEGATRADASDSGSGASSSKGDDKGAVTKADPVGVGETVELEGTRYTVDSVETSKTVGGEFFQEEAGGVYVVVELTIENTKDETKTFLSEAAKLIGSNDKSYSTDDDGSIAADEPLILEDMQPDVPKTGVLVYDIPGDAVKGATLEVSDLFGKGEAYVDLGL